MSQVLSLPNNDEDRLAVYQAMIDELEPYLESDALHRQLVIQTSGATLMPNMTVGSILAMRQALERSMPHLLPGQRAQFEASTLELRRIRDRHIDSYMDKIRRELKSLLDSWTWFIDGCEHGEADCADDYASEVWIRTRLEDLLDEARGRGMSVREEQDRLAELDERLRPMHRDGAYIGRPRQQADRPAERYWWLYGSVAPGH